MSLETIRSQMLASAMHVEAKAGARAPALPIDVSGVLASAASTSANPGSSADARSAVKPADDRAIVVRRAAKRYRIGKNNDVHALRDASIEIERGEMVAIVGPSGSGKSTMMHIVGCLDQPDSGEVWINGRRADTLHGKALTRLRGTEIGFIFQGFNLIPTLSAVENVALAAEYAGVSRRQALRRAEELLALVGLPERGRHLPSELSGGQQQRVAIARSLINSPSIVLGDEPTGDLDTATSDEIVSLMRQVCRDTKTTFVIVTHNPEVAAACDRTITMRDGRVEDSGRVAAVEPGTRVALNRSDGTCRRVPAPSYA